MVTVSHLLGGAAVGKLARRPAVAWPAALLSHFVLDYVPHDDLDSYSFASHHWPEQLHTAIGIANAVTVLLIMGLAARRETQSSARWAIGGGAFFGVLIDALEVFPRGSGWFQTSPATAWISHFHHSFHHSVGRDGFALGVATQVVLVLVALWVLARRGGPGPAGSGGQDSAPAQAP
jgi:hypothetical protein